MKNINITIFKTIWILLFLIASCTDDFEALNTDPYGLTDEQSEADFISVGGPFNPIFLNIYRYDPAWQTQLQHNLNADTFSGYMAPPRPFVGGINTTNYGFVDFWDQFPWDVPYSSTGVMQNARLIKERGETDFPLMYALAQILRVEAMHRVTDVYGPIVYSKYGLDATFAEYDSQQEVYAQFFEELDQAIQTLSSDPTNNQFAKFDLVYDGDLVQWIKFANTLRLRLAIRIAKVDPGKAKIEGEKSLTNDLGLLETNADNFNIKGGITHPLTVFNSSWNDVRMNASMESILVGFQDPRLEQMFEVSSVSSGMFKGIRGGMPLLERYTEELDQKEDYEVFSRLGDSYILDKTPTTSIQLMTAAEAYFLKAEAALRGWSNAGDAQSNYEMGISTSFTQYELSSEASVYMTNNTNTPIDYIDPVNASNNINALTAITIAWDNADTNEMKLEKIITQKWIAMFPDGQEAWSEFRRTGYPKIFPVVANNSDGTIDTNIQIRRLPFPASERSTNPQGIEGARMLLNGPDTGGTRLWWDVNSGNF
ncbi:RagB/SusD family nutrient uptake outer membrane protein [Aquimarina algicola]|uniref:SusD/RagB family nutrient-binding outer membrane lipoprotein n=1 Tax=Aquimarina algicola TaxID=2589995 RepID=A0A504J0G7_9FLAO|nr:RagB/SusD family nutrient uptake outer membrane protein [Aquimarina algicola]TPN81183.1 SusD/RagB family nutrient-binding outer membrane lipoprotein [Aquimarina algicola]